MGITIASAGNYVGYGYLVKHAQQSVTYTTQSGYVVLIMGTTLQALHHVDWTRSAFWNGISSELKATISREINAYSLGNWRLLTHGVISILDPPVFLWSLTDFNQLPGFLGATGTDLSIDALRGVWALPYYTGCGNGGWSEIQLTCAPSSIGSYCNAAGFKVYSENHNCHKVFIKNIYIHVSRLPRVNI
jgi:hypothetical protein